MKIRDLERTVWNMHEKVTEGVESEFKHKNLQTKVKDLESKLKSSVDELEAVQNEKCSILKEKGELEEEIQFLELNNKNQRAINKRINGEMIDSRNRLIREKEAESKILKKEAKTWKKKLGKERKKSINLRS